MDSFLSTEVIEGIEQARKRATRSGNRVCVHVGQTVVPILTAWENGFSVSRDNERTLRGLVDVYDGPKHLYQCLVVCSELKEGCINYEFKRATDATAQPPVDFVRSSDAPIALLK